MDGNGNQPGFSFEPGFAPDGRTSTLRLRRGYANKKVKGPSEQAQGPFTFSFAVRAGFEPAVRLPVRQFSKLVVSATHPSHQADPFFQWDCKDINKFRFSPKKMRGLC